MKYTNEKYAIKIAKHILIINFLLSIFKLVAGLIAHSTALVSDAIHTLTDAFTTIIVIIGIKVADPKTDKEHPYGHERFESITAVLLAIIVFITGIMIGLAGLKQFINFQKKEITAPGLLALIGAITSLLVKEGMYWYTKHAAKKIKSGTLMADAWHHRSDALASLGSFIGIFGARLGFPILDPIACLIICLFILKAAYDIFKDAIEKLTDKACDEEIIIKMKEIIAKQENVLGIDVLRTRLFGDKIFVEVEIFADGMHTLVESHTIAHNVHDAVEKNFSQVKHCMVHVNPYKIEEDQSSNLY